MSLHLKKPLVYVARDIERALGMEPGVYGNGGYFIISNDTPYGREVKAKYPEHVLLIENKENAGVQLDTFDLLSLPEVDETLSRQDADVLVFQNTSRIERLSKGKDWCLLNPSAELSKIVEEKISQVSWLGNDASLLPPHKVTTTKEVRFSGKKFVLQYNHSHTGQGTYVISDATELNRLQEKFPNRECRVVDFIDGPVFTINVCVGTFIIPGSISYQITGLSPFTDLPFSTVGNDWSLANDKEIVSKINKMANTIGKKMKKAGWIGLFGIDVIKDQNTGEIFLLEINARQPASVAFESELAQKESPKKSTIFEAHISSLLKKTLWPWNISRIKDGAQIVKRETSIKYSIDTDRLKAKNLSVMKYENSEHNQELFRIKSNQGIMESHGKLNELGKYIASCIK